MCAGVLVALSLPPWGFWPLAFAGIALLAGLLVGASARERALIGLAAGAGQYGPGLLWALHFTGAGYVLLVALESSFTALATTLALPGRLRVPCLAGLLTLAEWARDSWPFGGLPLAGIALGQAGGPVAGLARIGGPLLVGAAVHLTGAGIGDGAARAIARRRDSGPERAGLLGFGAPAAVVAVALGVALAGAAPAGGPVLRRVPAVAVQGGGPRGLDQAQVPTARVLAATVAGTKAVKPGPQLLLWPEDVLALAGPLPGSAGERLLAGFARRLHASLLAGVTAPAGTGHFDNEIVAISPAGRLLATFEKVHAVPFGEYVPDRSFFAHFVDLSAVPLDVVLGHGSGMVATPAGRYALLVSFETFFPSRGRSGVRAGGEALLVATNTSSYSGSQVPTEELAASRLQAISEGRDLLQAATTGFSAAIGPNGSVSVASRLGVRDLVATTLRLRDGRTLYTRWGDEPWLVLSAAAVLAGWLDAALRRAAGGTGRRRAGPRGASGAAAGAAAGAGARERSAQEPSEEEDA